MHTYMHTCLLMLDTKLEHNIYFSLQLYNTSISTVSFLSACTLLLLAFKKRTNLCMHALSLSLSLSLSLICMLLLPLTTPEETPDSLPSVSTIASVPLLPVTTVGCDQQHSVVNTLQLSLSQSLLGGFVPSKLDGSTFPDTYKLSSAFAQPMLPFQLRTSLSLFALS